jgi:hypothetical protein
MSCTADQGLEVEGQPLQDGDEVTQRDYTTTLDTLSRKAGFQWRRLTQPSMPALSSDLKSPQAASARKSDAFKSTWSSILRTSEAAYLN